MLRDLPPFSTDDHTISLTDMPSPDQHQEANTNELFDDIFGSAPASPTHHGEEDNPGPNIRGHEHSDITRLRNTHVTNGYREGIAESKEKFMQEGFDEGYALGAELGLRAGWCLGVIEGICRALLDVGADLSQEGPKLNGLREVLMAQAQVELKMEKLFAADFFGEDGIWLFEVPGEEKNITFRQVAAGHPVLKKWTDRTLSLMREYGLMTASSVAESSIEPVVDG